MSIENFFYLNVLGEIKSANFPLGADGSGVFIRYDIVAGEELGNGFRSKSWTHAVCQQWKIFR